ncbi:MAG: hypothetical protein IPK10_07715 [Bacteroidetes bacterium]|nr:hypothetical protein [Bacteroidota bacterium]
MAQLLLMAHMVVYCVYLLFKIRKEKRVGHINKWLTIIVSLFGVYIASYISYYIMVRYPWFTLTTDYFVSLGMCASIVAIIYFAYGKNKILEGYLLKESLKLENIYFSYKEVSSDHISEKKKDETIIYNYQSSLNLDSTKDEVQIELEKRRIQDLVLEIVSLKYKIRD